MNRALVGRLGIRGSRCRRPRCRRCDRSRACEFRSLLDLRGGDAVMDRSFPTGGFCLSPYRRLRLDRRLCHYLLGYRIVFQSQGVGSFLHDYIPLSVRASTRHSWFISILSIILTHIFPVGNRNFVKKTRELQKNGQYNPYSGTFSDFLRRYSEDSKEQQPMVR